MSNNQKMREALEFAVRQLTMAIEDDETGGNLLYLAGCMRVVANKCISALAEPPKPMVNNAKMRKALMDVAEQIQDEAKWADEMSYQQAIALGIIQSSLATPPRNCDLYDSEEDAWEAYLKIHPNAECPNDEYEMWLFDPAEAKGGAE